MQFILLGGAVMMAYAGVMDRMNERWLGDGGLGVSARDALTRATAPKDADMVRIHGATHIETYCVPGYIDTAASAPTRFLARTIGARA